uniref:Small ribosomal subunit protein uS3c n=1 Tax=Olisthodiscus luteus TaxID=83000 RepID=A0A7U0QGE1_OLILU|nr:ribosomal protein S3 [Olisthodiscus luteus]QQW50590.1 ribosomal protein S3 [Olisthodiscus luteus]
MGQKVHPLGFRINITRGHRSVWFSKFNNYANFLEEDYKIRQVIEKTLAKKGKITETIIERDNDGKTLEVKIHTANPAFVVGVNGTGLRVLQKNIRKVCKPNSKIKINLTPIGKNERNAILIADFLVEQLENRVAFRRALKSAKLYADAQNSGKGIKIQISGRLNGAEMARSDGDREGRVPLQTIRADIDYARRTAQTIYGLLGVKIWFFRGEV